MPTNILRNSPVRPVSRAGGPRAGEGAPRIALLTVGSAAPIRLQLADTETATRIWLALPLYSVAETWGECIHFEVPVDTGRDRSAKINGTAGEVYFWAEDDRIVVPFGATPISRPGEIRLPRPCNVWARALDDVRGLLGVEPGQKVGLVAVVEPPGSDASQRA